MPCLSEERAIHQTVNLSRFRDLHPDGRRLINSWFNRSLQMLDCSPQDSFEPFIFLWIAFNGWASCVTGKDRDSEWIQALSKDETLRADFLRALRLDNSLDELSRKFSEMWPIFKAQQIRRARAQTDNPNMTRQAIIQHYLENGIDQYAPRCWIEDRDNLEQPLVDWPHTLAALYRVRNNLFHGEKSTHSEMDQQIVHVSFRVLARFLGESGYFS